jgi:hypothetical protein
MADVFRTLIVAASDATFVREIAATLGPDTSQGMFTTPLAPTADGAATHYVSSGWIGEAWALLAPCTTWAWQDDAWVAVAHYDGRPDLIVQQCAALGLTVDEAQLAAAFARSDVSAQDPWTAFARLGVTLVQDAAA